MGRKKKNNTQSKVMQIIIFLLSLLSISYTYFFTDVFTIATTETSIENHTVNVSSINDLPKYSGNAYITLNDNIPNFEDKHYDIFESYSELDYLNRAGVAFANLGIETMPTEERESIGSVKPSGWQSIKYDIVDGKYLYNRCHLIGFQLSSENANEKNLITGTRYFNVDGMLPFEDDVADYIIETNNHVLYRVTPIYTGTNLIADGVQIEAQSYEDNGETLSFNVFVYNIQPGVEIDYSNGNSKLK